jgi:hypothetical protein
MNYADLFKNRSLQFVRNFVGKIVYDGLNAPVNQLTEAVVIGLSALIILFALYKLVWWVWESLKFIISCWQW